MGRTARTAALAISSAASRTLDAIDRRDAAFDRALVAFDDNGCPEFSSALSEVARSQLCWHDPIPLTDNHRERLAWHRDNLFDQG